MRLDLGCGKNKIKVEGQEWIGVDAIAFDGVDAVADLSGYIWLFEKSDLPGLELHPTTMLPERWKLPDNSVDQVHCSHMLEHLTGEQRVHFFNELYRVLKPGAQANIITPHWSHERAYGDPTHQWPPVCSWTYFYLDKDWREVNAPHCGYNCDFTYVLSGSHDPNDQWVAFRNMETKHVMMSRNINTTTDLFATLTKR